MEANEGDAQTNSDFIDLQLKALIADERWKEAMELWEMAKPHLNLHVRDKFKQYFLMREGRQKDARQVSHVVAAKARNRSVHNASALPVAKSFSYDPKSDQVLCFCCVFNGIEFAEWFLTYYRKLGVDHFFFVDNASTDATCEYLMKQEDVSVFWQRVSSKIQPTACTGLTI